MAAETRLWVRDGTGRSVTVVLDRADDFGALCWAFRAIKAMGVEGFAADEAKAKELGVTVVVK